VSVVHDKNAVGLVETVNTKKFKRKTYLTLTLKLTPKPKDLNEVKKNWSVP